LHFLSSRILHLPTSVLKKTDFFFDFLKSSNSQPARTGQQAGEPVQDSRNRTPRTGIGDKTVRTGRGEHDSKERTPGTKELKPRLPGKDS
jgi:hypothetical protein